LIQLKTVMVEANIAVERRDTEEEEIKAEGDEVNQGLQELLLED